jgi:hypothetical protein
MRLAVFRNPADLLSALLLCRRSLPDDVFPLSDGWGAPVHELAPEGELRELARQFGWDMEVVFLEEVPEPVPIFQMLAGTWSYRDPLGGASSRHALETFQGPSLASYDLMDEETDYLYILGARDEQESQAILHALGDCLVRGIEGTPILLDPLDGPCPFHFFWLVRWQRPDPSVLAKASRTWWGPLAHGAPQIFIQWPFSLAIPVAALQALRWGEQAAYALLSKDAPDYLILRRRGQDLVFREIQEVARLTTGPARVAKVTAASPPERPTLEVRIRLIEDEPRSKLASRAYEMAREIEAKRLIYEQMLLRLDSREPVVAALEPLFLYGERPGARGEIPYELRRLLVEWADLETDLRSLYYIHLKAEQLPRGAFLEKSSVHVVTTGAALGNRESGQVGVRLWEYTPGELCFNLRPEWADYGVRVFTPDRTCPEIYPDMRPGRVGATRLAEALLPGTPDASAHWIALLFPDGEGQLHVVRLRIADFKPLCDAWQWNCRLNVQLDEPALAVELEEATLPQVWSSIGLSFQASVQAEAQGTLDALLPPVLADIKRLDGEVRTIQQRLEGQHKLVKDLRGTEADLNKTVAASRRTAAEVAEALRRVREDTASAAAALKAIPDLLKSIVLLQGEIDALAKRLSAIRTSLPAPPGGGRAGTRN